MRNYRSERGLFLDCVIKRCNPSHSSLFIQLVGRQGKLYGRPARQTSSHGCFASADSRRSAKKMGDSDASFAEHKELMVLEIVRGIWVYNKLRNFRAGIDANVSVLKRAFGGEPSGFFNSGASEPLETLREQVTNSVVSE